MAETFTPNLALSKFDQGDNPPDYTAAKHNANWTKIDLEIFNRIKKDGSVPFTGPQSMGGFKLTSLANPTALQDAATKAYVDSLSDLFAATRIVDPTGAGTDTTITAAIAALPSAGGDIYIKPGTYAIAAALDFSTKVVRLHGAGSSVNFISGPTTLVPAAGISLFKNGAQGCSVSDIVAEGDNTSSQIFYEGSAEVRFIRVNIHDIAGITKGTGEILFRDSFIGVPSGPSIPLADRYIWKGGAAGGTLTWDGVEVFISGGGATLMSGSTPTSDGPTFKVVNSYTGGGGGGGSTNFYYASVIDWVSFDIDNAQFEISAARNNVVNCNFMDFSIKFKAIWNFISNSNFSGGGTGGSLFSSQLEFSGGSAGVKNESLVTNCNFYGNSSITGITVTNTFPVVISNCILSGQSSRGIFAAGGTSPNVSQLSVTGCHFESVTAPVVEGSTDVIGRYESNKNFGGSTILGTLSIVDGGNTRTISTTPVTLNESHKTVLSDATTGARTINLPTAASAKYRIYEIIKSDSSVNIVTIDASGAETINGSLTKTLTAQYDKIRIQSDGTTWWVL